MHTSCAAPMTSGLMTCSHVFYLDESDEEFRIRNGVVGSPFTRRACTSRIRNTQAAVCAWKLLPSLARVFTLMLTWPCPRRYPLWARTVALGGHLSPTCCVAFAKGHEVVTKSQRGGQGHLRGAFPLATAGHSMTRSGRAESP